MLEVIRNELINENLQRPGPLVFRHDAGRQCTVVEVPSGLEEPTKETHQAP